MIIACIYLFLRNKVLSLFHLILLVPMAMWHVQGTNTQNKSEHIHYELECTGKQLIWSDQASNPECSAHWPESDDLSYKFAQIKLLFILYNIFHDSTLTGFFKLNCPIFFSKTGRFYKTNNEIIIHNVNILFKRSSDICCKPSLH